MWCAAGGNLHDILREEEAKAAAVRAAQPVSTDVKTAAPGANRASGWARVAASPTASRGTYIIVPLCLASTWLTIYVMCPFALYSITAYLQYTQGSFRSQVQHGKCVGYTARSLLITPHA